MDRMREIKELEFGERPMALRLTFDDGRHLDVDLGPDVARLPVLAPLRDPKRFRKARLGEDGAFVHWSDDAEIDAEALYRKGLVQAGESLEPAAFKAWRKERFRSQANAGEALGIAERLVRYYESGERIIPKTVMLAVYGYDARHAAE
jgi:hypothetical protein